VRIAIDCRELEGRRTGVGRYVAELLDAWRTMSDAQRHEFIRLSPENPHDGTAWEQLTLPGLVRKAGAEVLFAPGYTAPLRCQAPVVVTIHDVSFAAHPEWFTWREGARRRTLTRLTALKARRILAVSQFSKREIVRYLDVPSEKVRVIYSGVSRSFSPPGPRPRPRSQTVLFVGSLFNRRLIPELIVGFGVLAARHSDVSLEIVGDNRSLPRFDTAVLAAATGHADRIRARDYVADDELGDLYASARAFAFLSTYEGFGFTPLEALSAGIPIVVLDTAVSREVYGDAAIYVARPDPPLIAAALETAMFDDAARGRIALAAPAILARYSWRRCAEQVLAELVAAARTPR
jgi:glycosyltransferase involved in cell wall biosynthesis